MGAPSKRAKKIRKANEFDVAKLLAELSPPKVNDSVYAWNLEDIFAAREHQMLGRFKVPCRLAESMKTDDAISVAYENRLDPQRCIGVELVPAKGARAAPVAAEAEALFGQLGVGVTPDTMVDIHSALVDHGLAVGACVVTPREDGSRIDYAMKAWPMEFVRWDSTDRVLKTMTSSGVEVPIVHGDGRWVVFRKRELYPWKHGALLPAAIVWARHAFAARDWTKGSVAHGNAKVIGEMPVGMALQDADGALTKEAQAFLTLLRNIASGDAPIGIKPAGSKTEFLTNNSTAWQVWHELVLNAEKAAARIYLGTDGTLGAQGGAPGVDITALFGVATTKVQGDFQCIERALLTGLIEPWCALNFGDSTLAPTRRYLLPDPDEDARRASVGTRRSAFFADIKASRDNGFEITQAYVEATAKAYDVDAPLLPKQSAKAPTIMLAPTDIARVVTVNEARASAGVGQLLLEDGTPDPDGKLTVEQFAAKKAAEVAAALAPKPAQRSAPADSDPSPTPAA